MGLYQATLWGSVGLYQATLWGGGAVGLYQATFGGGAVGLYQPTFWGVSRTLSSQVVRAVIREPSEMWGAIGICSANYDAPALSIPNIGDIGPRYAICLIYQNNKL